MPDPAGAPDPQSGGQGTTDLHPDERNLMTGPEHYQQAESLLKSIDDWDATDPNDQAVVAQMTAEAQAHATLAQAAATAEAAGLVQIGDVSGRPVSPWARALTIEDVDA